MRPLAPFAPFVTFVSFVTFASFVTLRAQKPGAELIERTLAIVAGQPITLSDVRGALALGLIDVASADREAEATAHLIDRALVLREVQRYVPADPADDAVAARLQTLVGNASGAEAFRRALDSSGFSEARLRNWIRDDLRIAAYLDQRFAAAGVPVDEEVSAYYTQRREDFEAKGMSFEDAAPAIRQQLAEQRRAELIQDWIADLRRRTPVVILQ